MTMPGVGELVTDGVWALVEGDAISTAVVVLLAAGAVAGLAWAVLYLRRTPADRFRAVLEPHDTVDILLHPNPDPDAMACGFAAATIARSAGIDARIVYLGQLRHDENRAFRTVLGLELVRFDEADGISERPVVLVDHASPRGFTASIQLDVIAVVDHHDDPPTAAEHVDVRSHYGAASSIFWEYLDDLGAVPEGESGPLVITHELATALAYGIQTDTNWLTRGVTSHDIEALEGLHDLVDATALERIGNPPVEPAVLDAKATAIRNRELIGPYCIADLGEVSSADALAITAEELATLEGVSTAVTIGDLDGELHLSGRSIDDRVHMGEALERAMAAVPGASAGGHARMGGGQVDLKALEGIGPNTGLEREELPDRLISSLRDSD